MHPGKPKDTQRKRTLGQLIVGSPQPPYFIPKGCDLAQIVMCTVRHACTEGQLNWTLSNYIKADDRPWHLALKQETTPSSTFMNVCLTLLIFTEAIMIFHEDLFWRITTINYQNINWNFSVLTGEQSIKVVVSLSQAMNKFRLLGAFFSFLFFSPHLRVLITCTNHFSFINMVYMWVASQVLCHHGTNY